MEMEKVSVLIVDKSQERVGVLANAAFVLGLTAGRELEMSTFGHDATDKSGGVHTYLTRIGHYVRKAGQSKLRALRDELKAFPDVIVIDYPEAAAPADYNEYTSLLGTQEAEEICYRAIYIYGPAELVVPRTKNLSAL